MQNLRDLITRPHGLSELQYLAGRGNTGKAELIPFQNGRVTIDTLYKKKKRTVRIILEDEKKSE